MIPTFRPWTHTSDDSYIYQLSLVVATATVYFFIYGPMPLRRHLATVIPGYCADALFVTRKCWHVVLLYATMVTTHSPTNTNPPSHN